MATPLSRGRPSAIRCTRLPRYISESVRLAFATHLVMACMLFAAKRQAVRANALLATYFVIDPINDCSVDHRLGGLAAAGAFHGCFVCFLVHGVLLRWIPNCTRHQVQIESVRLLLTVLPRSIRRSQCGNRPPQLRQSLSRPVFCISRFLKSGGFRRVPGSSCLCKQTCIYKSMLVHHMQVSLCIFLGTKKNPL